MNTVYRKCSLNPHCYKWDLAHKVREGVTLQALCMGCLATSKLVLHVYVKIYHNRHCSIASSSIES